VRSSSGFPIFCTPSARARSSVRFWLHAITFMPKACPTLATCEPMRPRPMMPSVEPARSAPMVDCHRPSSTARVSSGMCLKVARMSAQVSSTVAEAGESVLHTVMEFFRAACTSMAALARPVVTRSRKLGRAERRCASKRVRSRIATTMSMSCNVATRSSVLVKGSCRNLSSWPWRVRGSQSALEAATD
jgi:hypothetical protein